MVKLTGYFNHTMVKLTGYFNHTMVKKTGYLEPIFRTEALKTPGVILNLCLDS